MKLFTTLLLATTLVGSGITDTKTDFTEPNEQTEERTETPEVTYKLIGSGFNYNETEALEFFQNHGITDKMALAVILGNIKQESKFLPNICEGGARVPYSSCYRGGYGLIQWTTSGRYWGLGNYASKSGGDASSLRTQLEYLVTEREWKSACSKFRTPDKSMNYYMNVAYTWLGWGIEGSRGYYSQDYYNRLS